MYAVPARSIVCALLTACVVALSVTSVAQATLSITTATSGSSQQVSYTWTLADAPATTPTIVYTYTGGGQAAVGASWTLTASTDTLGTPSGTISFNPKAVASPGCSSMCVPSMSSSTKLARLLDGQYSVVMTYAKSSGTSTSNARTVSIETETNTPHITAPAASSYGGVSALSVAYDLTEAAQAGTVALVFTPTGVCSGGSVSLVMASTQTVAASLNYSDPISSGSVASGSGSFVRGCTYTMTLSYQDILAHPAASAAVVEVSVPDVPGAPTSATALPAGTAATVSWSAPVANGAAVSGYVVTASPGGAQCVGASTECTITGLTDGEQYTFTVVATNGVGDGPASTATDPITIDATTQAPTITQMEIGPDGLTAAYTLPEVPTSGSVSLTFSPDGLCSGPAVTLPMGDAQSAAIGVSYSGHLVRGCSYTPTLGYQDARGNPFASAVTAAFPVPDEVVIVPPADDPGPPPVPPVVPPVVSPVAPPLPVEPVMSQEAVPDSSSPTPTPTPTPTPATVVPKVKKTKLRLPVGRSLPASRVTRTLGLQTVRGGKVTLKVATRSRKFCSIKSRRVYGKSVGPCSIIVSAVLTGRIVRHTVSIDVYRIKRKR